MYEFVSETAKSVIKLTQDFFEKRVLNKNIIHFTSTLDLANSFTTICITTTIIIFEP